MKRLFVKERPRETAPKEQSQLQRRALPATREQLKRLNDAAATFYELVSRAIVGEIEFPDFDATQRGQGGEEEVVLTLHDEGSTEGLAIAVHEERKPGEEHGTWVLVKESRLPSPQGGFDPSAKMTIAERFPVSDTAKPETVIYEHSGAFDRVEVRRSMDPSPLDGETCDNLANSLAGVIALRKAVLSMRPPQAA